MSVPENSARHPFGALEQLIKRDQLSADYVVTPGDLGDKANPKALAYAWSRLERLVGALGARRLIATPGNHDVDSRHQYNDFDAKGSLQELAPIFPFDDEASADRFWARHYVILDEPSCRLILLNSSAYHGSRENGKPPEYAHGRVSRRTIAAIERELAARGRHSTGVQILVCHHHPHKHGDIEADDYSVMEDGAALIDMLSRRGQGRWMIVHGHKHQPRITYAAGSARAPVVFGAGSFSAILYPQLQGKARNQFYILDFPWQGYSALGLELAGTFRAWDWNPGLGWQPAGVGSGLPAKGGFGYLPQLPEEAAFVESSLGSRPFMEWQEIVESRPRLQYLLPDDVDHLIAELRGRSIEAVVDQFGGIRQIAPQSRKAKP